MGRLPLFPNSLTFSTPAGTDGCDGNGRTRVWIAGRASRSEDTIGRFLGVIKMVMSRFLRDNWWVRSRRGSMWPCAGYGNTRTWVALLLEQLDMADSFLCFLIQIQILDE